MTQVPRLQGVVRDRRANWDQSIAMLEAAKAAGAQVTKTSIMLGCGEHRQEVIEAMQLLRQAGIVTHSDICSFNWHIDMRVVLKSCAGMLSCGQVGLPVRNSKSGCNDTWAAEVLGSCCPSAWCLQTLSCLVLFGMLLMLTCLAACRCGRGHSWAIYAAHQAAHACCRVCDARGLCSIPAGG